MRAWFYPGDNFGQEFAYPKTAAVQIASVNNASVPTTEAQNEADLATAKVTTVDKTGTEQELDRQTYTAATEKPATEQMAQNTAPAPATQPMATEQAQPMATDNGERSRSLPSTGSPFPVFGLIGFASLGGSMLVRAIAAKRS